MAELLVLLKSHWPGDTYAKQQLKIETDLTISEEEKASRKEALAQKYKLRYERGDAIVLFGDGHEWGKLETSPTCCVIKYPGIPVADMQQYVDPYLTIELEIQRSREWQFLIDTFPSDALAKTDEGELTIDTDISWAELKDSLYSHELEHTELRESIRG